MRDDPVEKVIADALDAVGIAHIREVAPNGPNGRSLDFYVPSWGIYIECKRYHAGRVVHQMASVPDILVAQGMPAAIVLANLIRQQAYMGDKDD